MCEKINDAADEQQTLRDERRELVLELKAAGVPRAELAELTGTSIDNVKQILRRP